jgi:hypothetical protein
VREERFPWGLGAILVLVIVGGIGFWLGSSSVAPVIVSVAAPVAPAPAPVTPVYPTYVPHGGGFPLFPLFFGLIFLVVAFKFVRRAAWASHAGGPGSYGGPGPWGGHSRGRRDRGWYGPGPDADAPQTQPDSERAESMSSSSSGAATGNTRQRRGGWPDGMSKARDYWNGRDVPPMVDEMFQRWHARMHGEPAPESSTEPTKDETTAGGSLNLPPSDPPTDASSS